jgi:hypothetical protein
MAGGFSHRYQGVISSAFPLYPQVKHEAQPGVVRDHLD